MAPPSHYTQNSPPMIGLLTDFGSEDAYVGIMKSVILTICPHVPVIDLCHDIAGQNVLSGAYILSTTATYLPTGAVVVAVVDPGVGTDRRAIAVRTQKNILVGPDNGLFTIFLKRNPAAEAINIDNSDYFLHPVSPTFHGRDIFAPVGAHFACGAKFHDVGSPIHSSELVQLAGCKPLFYKNDIEAHVIHIDRFGNVITNLTRFEYEQWGHDSDNLIVELEGSARVRLVRTFADVALYAPLAFWGSGGHLEIAVRDSNAAAYFGLAQASSTIIVRPRVSTDAHP